MQVTQVTFYLDIVSTTRQGKRAHSTARQNKRKSVANQEKFVAGYRRHIGPDEWTLVMQPMSLLEYYENVQLVGH